MKNSLITILLSLLSLTGFSQDLRYSVHGAYTHPVKKEKLENAKLIRDFISGYPVNWISEYLSVEISATCNGKVVKAVSKNDILSTEQKNILKNADIGTMIDIDIKYHYKNTVTDNKENYRAYFSVSVIPEVEAEYYGGYQQLIKYLEQNAISKISDTYMARRDAYTKYQQSVASLTANVGYSIDNIYNAYLWKSLANSIQIKQGIVRFTINEEGDIVNAKTTSSTGDIEIDKVLLNAIIKMPKWKPAENSQGIKVKQEFEFSVGDNGC